MIQTKTVPRLLKKYGRDYTYEDKGTATYDPINAGVDRSGNTSQVVRGYIYNAKYYDTVARAELRGSRSLLIDGTNVEPTNGDKFTYSDKIYTVKDIVEVIQLEDSLFYILRVVD